MNIHYYQLTAPPSCDGDLLRVENGHSELFRPGAVQEWFPVSFGPDPKAQEITKDEASWLMRWTRRRIQQIYTLAVEIAAEAHQGQVDKGGAPYLLHPVEVARQVPWMESKIAAMLHDVAEDTDISLDRLAALFPPKILDALRLLTHDPKDTYEEYIQKIGYNTIATQVKLADLKHNMDISRIHHPTKRDLERLMRYRKAYAYLYARRLPVMEEAPAK